jgi:hypothetical protein
VATVYLGRRTSGNSRTISGFSVILSRGAYRYVSLRPITSGSPVNGAEREPPTNQSGMPRRRNRGRRTYLNRRLVSHGFSDQQTQRACQRQLIDQSPSCLPRRKDASTP